MQAGIVRRIDELGRIVIPKEMRRTMRLQVGDEMEICSDGENITLKRYSGFQSVLSEVKGIAKSLCEYTEADVLFVSCGRVIVSEGANKKHYQGAIVSEKFGKIAAERNVVILHGDDLNGLFDDRSALCCYCVVEPIVVHGDVIGAAALMLDGLPSDVARAYLHFCAELVARSLE